MTNATGNIKKRQLVSYAGQAGNTAATGKKNLRRAQHDTTILPPGMEIRAAMELDRTVTRATQSLILTKAELGVILDKMDGIKTKPALKEAFTILNRAVDSSLMDLESRGALMHKLFERAQAIRGGTEVIPMAMTEAVGEDVFGMGGVPLGSVATIVLKVANDDVVTPAEARRLATALGKVGSEFELHGAYAALRFLVQGSVITTDERATLARAYSDAVARLGGGFVAVTRSLDEDVFGGGRLSAASDLVAKGIINGSLDKGECAAVIKEIGKIQQGRTDQLLEVYTALVDAIGVRIEGAELISPKDRSALARAVLDANQRLGGNALPIGMTNPRAGEDLFGTKDGPLMPIETTIRRSIADNEISGQQTQSLIRHVQGFKKKKDFEQAFAVLKHTVSLNMITREDRELLKDAVSAKAQQLGVHPPVTRGLFEDILGFQPVI